MSVSRIITHFALRRRRRLVAQELAHLGDHLLRDIGLPQTAFAPQERIRQRRSNP